MTERMVIVIEYDADMDPDGAAALQEAADKIKATLTVPHATVVQMYVAIRESAAAVLTIFAPPPPRGPSGLMTGIWPTKAGEATHELDKGEPRA